MSQPSLPAPDPAPAAVSPTDLLLDTWRGILAPRRLAPITVVSLAMLGSEVFYTRTVQGALEAALICAAFLAWGPWLWRALLGETQPVTAGRVVLFLVSGAVLPFLAWVKPYVGAGPHTFLAAGVNGLVVASLFWVGAWGIGRDIEMEQGIAAARQRAEALAREAERAQLLAIRSHLDPHFLFNTLNAIAEWCREDGEVAENAVLRLSGLLRDVMDGVKAERWPLSRELKLLEDLWALHQVRDPSRFTVERTLPDPLPTLQVPPMVLLPLAENAVKHGPAAGHRGPLRLSLALTEAGGLVAHLSNPGAFRGPRPGGEGLELVRRRLALAYGRAARFEIGPDPADPTRTLAVVEVDSPAAGHDADGTGGRGRP